MQRRECGECRACCTALAVKALEKPAGTPCPKLAADTACPGCTIYDERPTPCREFACLWLLEPKSVWRRFRERQLGTKAFLPLLDDGQRPEKLGAIFELTRPDSALRRSTGLYLIVARAMTPGVFDGEDSAARAAVLHVAKSFPVMMIDGDKRQLASDSDETAKTVMRFATTARAGL